MSRKTTAALIAALGINFALAGGALFLANLNKPIAYDPDAAFDTAVGEITSVAGKPVDAQAGDQAAPLRAAQQGGNTRVTFTCGKTSNAGREEHQGTWGQIAGAVLYRADDQQLIAIEAMFDTRSLRTDAQALTNTVTVKERWFDIDNHPRATFTCDTVKPADAATASHTHDLVGSFTLNGITKPLTIPAKLVFTGQSLTIDASFTILRSDFDVKKRESSVAGTAGALSGAEVDDEVRLAVRVTASPDPTVAIRELAQQVEEQQEQLRIANAEIGQLKMLSRRLELLEEKADGLASTPPSDASAIDTAGLPKTYTDLAEGDNRQVPFEMVLVQGDHAKGIDPFYMAANEVSWEMIKRWMYCNDLEQAGVPATEIAKLIAAGNRPSPLFEEPAQIVRVPDEQRPAIAVSMLTAKAYCKWLSEKTGRRYRLPTIDEWRHAMKLGGGLPENLDASVWHEGTIGFTELGRPQAGEVGTKKPNALGIYDMFGNACEWVTGTGVDRVVVGGHFLMPPQEFSEDWRAVEDVEVWNATHPQIPKGRFWISDFHYTGIRLVCEVPSVIKNPPSETRE